MHKDNLKSFALLAAGLGAGALLATFVACDSPPVNCDTDYQCSQTPACKAKHEDFIVGRASADCDGTPWTEPYYYVGHKCNFRGQSYYSDDRKMLQSRCMWVHRA